MKKTWLTLSVCSLVLGLAVGCGDDDGGGNGDNTGDSEAGAGGDDSGNGNTTAGRANNTAGRTGIGGQSSNGGQGNNGGSFSTGLDDSDVLGELSAAQQEQLCEKVDAYVDGSVYQRPALDLECRLMGVTSASLATSDEEAEEACTEAYDACIERGMHQFGAPECTPFESTCTATVGELEACVRDFPSVFQELGAIVPSCEGLTLEALEDFGEAASDGGLDDFQPPPSCATFEEKCPDPGAGGAGGGG